MKLDMDCVRAVLLCVEKMPFNSYLTIDQLCNNLQDYDEECVHYAALKLIEAGYLTGSTLPVMRSYLPEIKGIYDMTFQGHEFLNEIREPERWEKVKEKAKKIGAFSFQAVMEIAKALTVAVLSTQPSPRR